MHNVDFLDEIVIVSAMAILVIVLFQRLRIPAVIGLIATGIILGPTGFAIVAQGQLISTLAELGVTLLLFTIGLEFSLDELRSMRRLVLGGGSLQVVATALLAGLLSAIGFAMAGIASSWSTFVFIGLTVSVSSTAICAKLLKERRELSMPHGRAAMGVLLFQDMAVVPLMIAISLMDPTTTSNPAEVLLRIGAFVGFGLAIAVGLRFVLPRMARVVSMVDAPEVMVLGALVMCFGAAYLTSLAGMSMALGAFMAGVIVAGTEQGHRIGRAVETMRDAFTSIFFISVGLLLHVDAAYIMPTLIGAVIVVVLKAIVVSLVLLVLGTPRRVAIMAGLVLAQVGEFSFVLAETGRTAGLIDDRGFQAMLLVIIVTMTLAPLLISTAPRIAERTMPLSRFAPLSSTLKGATNDAVRTQEPDVVIIGFGVHGRNVAGVLEATQIPYSVLEMSGASVERFRRDGIPIMFGDATDAHDLKKAGIKAAQAVIIAISDQAAVSMATRTIRKARPDIFIIARTRYARDAETIADAGADVVVTEEYESSIQVFVTLLSHLGVGSEVIAEQESLMRSDRYGVLGSVTASTREQA